MSRDPTEPIEVRLARLEERDWAADQALSKAERELARRLDLLNHAHEEAQRVLNTYLPRESWEAWLKEEQQRREKVDAEMGVMRGLITSAQAASIAVAATNTRNLAVATLILGGLSLAANGVFSG